MSFNSVNQNTGDTTPIAGLYSGISDISVNGVAQTVTNHAVNIDVASNLITEAQWTQLQTIFS